MTKKERDALYYQTHKSVIRAKQKINNAVHKDEIYARLKAWREAHPEKVEQYLVESYKKLSHSDRTRKWRDENPKKAKNNARAYCILRRSREYSSKGAFEFSEWFLKVAYHGWRCLYCGVLLTETSLTIDHKIPLCRGGTNWLANLAPACRTCNCSKGKRTVQEFKLAKQS